MTIDHEAIKKLAGLLNETGLTEIEITEGDKSLRVQKSVHVQSYASAPSYAPASSAPAATAVTSSVAALSPDNHPGAVKSPMVGTAYLQSEPGAPKFVSKGAKIKAGDTICIIEAMKVMNPIKAEKGGTVTDVLIDDAQPVEFGQVLVIIE
ncbi:MAG TPA: acetyl-CoA carboxylase biotin carboxyl carrier protein [Patescibacteria group bacterium]|nr:acetyl-CoA carboxylase biotin carboxyl carrier protein [Patescibacteria group bacterium]